MIEAKLSIIDKEKYKFVSIDDKIFLKKPDKAEALQKTTQAVKVEEITIDGITLLGRSYDTLQGIKESFKAKHIITIDCPWASSKHTVIYLPKDNSSPYTIEDLESKNGTLVDGEKIPVGERYALNSDCEIMIGSVCLKFYQK